MPLSLIFLIGIIVICAAVGAYAVVTDRQRRAVLDRAGGYGDSLLLIKPQEPSLSERISKWLAKVMPESMAAKGETASMLVHAGFDSPAAPAVYAALRLATAVLIPFATLVLMPRTNKLFFLAALVLAVAIGVMGAPAVLANLARSRQEKLRRSLPDSLDLLVVCVEAGVSLDAAILRVAREMSTLHPQLSNELMLVNRRVNAGMPREQAMHGLWLRTGLEELRALAANMIQSEKWGTSIATVLRIFAETLRRKRKQTAEKKAATAPLKMMIPLAMFIFPTIFIVLMGPAIIKINDMFKGMQH
jgi:tight adherence protein C